MINCYSFLNCFFFVWVIQLHLLKSTAHTKMLSFKRKSPVLTTSLTRLSPDNQHPYTYPKGWHPDSPLRKTPERGLETLYTQDPLRKLRCVYGRERHIPVCGGPDPNNPPGTRCRPMFIAFSMRDDYQKSFLEKMERHPSGRFVIRVCLSKERLRDEPAELYLVLRFTLEGFDIEDEWMYKGGFIPSRTNTLMQKALLRTLVEATSLHCLASFMLVLNRSYFQLRSVRVFLKYANGLASRFLSAHQCVKEYSCDLLRRLNSDAAMHAGEFLRVADACGRSIDTEVDHEDGIRWDLHLQNKIHQVNSRNAGVFRYGIWGVCHRINGAYMLYSGRVQWNSVRLQPANKHMSGDSGFSNMCIIPDSAQPGRTAIIPDGDVLSGDSQAIVDSFFHFMTSMAYVKYSCKCGSEKTIDQYPIHSMIKNTCKYCGTIGSYHTQQSDATPIRLLVHMLSMAEKGHLLLDQYQKELDPCTVQLPDFSNAGAMYKGCDNSYTFVKISMAPIYKIMKNHPTLPYRSWAEANTADKKIFHSEEDAMNYCAQVIAVRGVTKVERLASNLTKAFRDIAARNRVLAYLTLTPHNWWGGSSDTERFRMFTLVEALEFRASEMTANDVLGVLGVALRHGAPVTPNTLAEVHKCMCKDLCIRKNNVDIEAVMANLRHIEKIQKSELLQQPYLNQAGMLSLAMTCRGTFHQLVPFFRRNQAKPLSTNLQNIGFAEFPLLNNVFNSREVCNLVSNFMGTGYPHYMMRDFHDVPLILRDWTLVVSPVFLNPKYTLPKKTCTTYDVRSDSDNSSDEDPLGINETSGNNDFDSDYTE